MKKALFVLISCLVLSQTAFAEKQLLDQVVAVVNEEAITQSELDGYLRPYFEQLKQQFQGENLMMEVNEARKKLLNQMVEDLLVYQEAKRLKIEVDEVAIDEQMIGLRGKFTDEKQMEEALHAEGLSMKMMKERLLRQQMIRQLHDQEVRSKIVVSPTELENYYKEHAAEF